MTLLSKDRPQQMEAKKKHENSDAAGGWWRILFGGEASNRTTAVGRVVGVERCDAFGVASEKTCKGM